MAKDYIPRANDKFHIFQQNLVKAVVANAVAWKIPADEVTAIQTSSDTYANLYKSLSNKATRTRMQIKAHDSFRKTYEPDLRQLVNAFMRSNKNIEASMLSTLGIKQRGRRRAQRTKIDTHPVLFMEPIGGMRMRFGCRIEAHEGRGSVHPESDGLELRYGLLDTLTNANLDQATQVHFSKKAHFQVEFPPAFRGKNLVLFVRWKNLTNDTLSGPWSGAYTGMVY